MSHLICRNYCVKFHAIPQLYRGWHETVHSRIGIRGARGVGGDHAQGIASFAEGDQRVGSAQLRQEQVQRAMHDRCRNRWGVAHQHAPGGPGQEAVCGGRSGSGTWGPTGSTCALPSQGGRRIRGASDRAQLQRSARRARAVVASPVGGARSGTGLYRQRLARDGAAGSKKNDLKPLRRVGWVIPPQRNADFAAGMERVLDLYRRPYDAYFPLVCMDETPRQLIGETRRPVPPAPGRPAREDYEYRRLGTCNVFMATEPLTGWRLTKADWAHFLRDIAAQFSGATRITLVMDNLNTHRPGALYDTFEPAEAKVLWDRFEFVYTPKHGSWLNVAEVEINVMIRQCLNRRIDSIDTLRNEVAAWQAARDQIRANVDWQFTTDDARVKLKCLYPTFDV